MALRQKLTRWIAWIVLLNIGVGFCDCLRDPVSLPVHSASSARLTDNTDRQGPTECGDNCESCVCHASLVTVEPVRLAVEFAVSRLATLAFVSVAEPDHVRLKRPPRG
jgi:hypothetical protein